LSSTKHSGAAETALDALPWPAQPASEAPEFARVFETYAGYVLTLLTRLGVEASDVDDVAQETFLTIHHKLPEFEQRSQLKTWICGICIRKAAAHRRGRARRRALLAATERAAAPAFVPVATDALLMAAERTRLFERALERLSPEQRAVFVLYEIEELTMADVADATGSPRFTCYTRLHAARRKLRAFYERVRAGEAQA